VQYFLDPSGNYKKYIVNTNYRYSVPQMTLKVHQFFYVDEGKVADIYFYIEGVSEELEQMGFDNRDINKIILKYPTEQWTDKTDPDVTEYYKSEFGKLTTNYGQYDNCIIVTKTSKATTTKFKWAENYSYKYYYAYKIGLVKTETYENGKLLKMEMSYGGTLVDNFSEYSFYIKEKEKKEKLEAERKRQEEIKKLNAFLLERKTKVYDYKELNSSDYNSINNSITSKIQNILKEKNINGIVEYKIVYTIDTLGSTSFSLLEIGSPNSEITNLIKPLIKDIQLKPVSKNGYSVFAKSEYTINIKLEEKTFEVKKNNVETVTINNPNNLYEKEISSLISSAPLGKYTIQIRKKEINNIDFSNNYVSKYKGIGGPSNMFLSVLVPGLGVKGVTGGSKSGLNRTLLSYGFILSGVGCKLWSMSEYDNYHSATDQSSIDQYYGSANFLNKSFYVLTATGVAIWIYDIIWVANKGFQNKKEQSLYKQKLSFYYEPNNQMLGLNYKLKF